MQVSRDGLTLHLSEHYGDGTPGPAVYVRVRNVRRLLAELHAKHHRYARPAPDAEEANLTDPFGNVLRLVDG